MKELKGHHHPHQITETLESPTLIEIIAEIGFVVPFTIWWLTKVVKSTHSTYIGQSQVYDKPTSMPFRTVFVQAIC